MKALFVFVALLVFLSKDLVHKQTSVLLLCPLMRVLIYTSFRGPTDGRAVKITIMTGLQVDNR